MDKLTDGITTDQKRVREDDVNVGAVIASLSLFIALLAIYFFFG